MTDKKISTESYKGVRDFYPEDMFVQKYMFDKMRAAAEKFGFVEYSASILEPAELYRGKTSEEIVDTQTYTFKDRGDREVTLRPEMTPSVARMVAARKRELSFPLRWYSIPNVFRYEQPQRGRLREHWQLNADIFGDSSLNAEVETISLVHHFFTLLGAKESDFEILVNSRTLLNSVWEKFEVAQESRQKLTRLIDSKEKMEAEKFTESIEEVVGKDKKTIAEKIVEMFSSTENFKKMMEMDQDVSIFPLIDCLKKIGINNVRFEPSITRGFDYYTGTVFEVFDTDPQNRRSLAGGGRYDNLLTMFGGESLPAVGFGLGDVTLRQFLETHNLLPTYISPTKLYIGIKGGELVSQAQQIAEKMRTLNINTILDFSNRIIGDRIKKALKDGVPYFAVIGEDEMKNNTLTVKNLATKEERQFSLDESANGLASLAEFLTKN